MSTLVPDLKTFPGGRALARTKSGAFDLDRDVSTDTEKSDTRALRVRCFTNFDEVEPLWRELESNGAGSVYQRFDWCKIWFETFVAHSSSTPLIVVVTFKDQTVMLLPLYRERSFLGLQQASFLGDRHANIRQPLLTVDHELRAILQSAVADNSLQQQLVNVLRDNGAIDHLHLGKMISVFNSADNLLFPWTNLASVDCAFTTELSHDFETFARTKRSKDALKKLRKKLRGLDHEGDVTFEEIRERSLLNAVLNSFFAQKHQRMNDIKLDNAFSLQADQSFVRALAVHSVEKKSGLLTFYTLRVDDQIIAYFAGGQFGTSFSGAITSMSTDPVFTKRSPGDLALFKLLQTLCDQDMTSFDLGIGQASYKNSWCEPRTLRSVSLPVTKRGFALSVIEAAKAKVRQLVLGDQKAAQLARHTKFHVKRLRSNPKA